MIKFSLIVATLGRRNELILFLDSLLLQTFPFEYFEVIIVDQNPDDLIKEIIASYESRLNIVHIRSSKKELAYSRNLGIKISRGFFICVPDDDCTYYPDTLHQVFSKIENKPDVDMVIGRVYDRTTQTHVFKRTPRTPVKINHYNFYNVVSSITIFFRKNDISFDEHFGIGAQFHSNEDGELILHYLAENKQVHYYPDIECNHPPYNASNTGIEKLYKYGIGFGAMCRKYFSPALLFLFLKVIGFQFMMTLFNILRLNKDNTARRWNALKGRWHGFFSY